MICDDQGFLIYIFFCHGVFKSLPFDLIVLCRKYIPAIINVEVRS